MSELIRLTEEDVMTIRQRMSSLRIATQDAFGQVKPLHPDKFSSAVFRQYTSGGGIYKYTTIHDLAATLFYGVAMSHAFENGNKRTALVSMLVVIDRNKSLLVDTSEDDLYEMAREVAAHEFPVQGGKRNADSEVQAIASWLRTRLRDKVLGDKAMTFKELRELLEEQGCEFGKPSANFIKINRGKAMVKTGYPKANFEIAVNEVKRIRRALELDDFHGVDSAAFYDLEAQVDHFVNHYRNLMVRLADL